MSKSSTLAVPTILCMVLKETKQFIRGSDHDRVGCPNKSTGQMMPIITKRAISLNRGPAEPGLTLMSWAIADLSSGIGMVEDFWPPISPVRSPLTRLSLFSEFLIERTYVGQSSAK